MKRPTITLPILLVLPVILMLPHQAYAWGSVTHSAICRAAGGDDDFALGGVAPDMIALHSVTTGDPSYNYAHNYFGDGRDPVFGNLMTRVSDRAFSRGWAAHQLADSVVHGPDGYSNTKTVFDGIPGKYKTELNHGAVELIVDAIVLDEFYERDLSLSVPDQTELIHTTAVSFYNDRMPAGIRITRSNIITCHTAANLAYQWDLCLNTNQYLAELILEEKWFSSVRRQFEDFRPLFSKSVALVGNQTSAAQPRSTRVISFWDRLAALLPADVAEAAEPEVTADRNATGEPAEYYRLLLRISQRAQKIGAGRITKESVRQAVVELDRETSLSDQERVWAAALAGMTDKKSADFDKVGQRVREAGRRASNKGAASGRGQGALPYLPCAAALAAAVVAAAWLFRKR